MAGVVQQHQRRVVVGGDFDARHAAPPPGKATFAIGLAALDDPTGRDNAEVDLRKLA